MGGHPAFLKVSDAPLIGHSEKSSAGPHGAMSDPNAIEFRFLELNHYDNEPHFRRFSKVLEARKQECTLLLPKGIPPQNLFESFLNHILLGIDQHRYLPVARFCDGEYRFYAGQETTTCWGERGSRLQNPGVERLHAEALRTIHEQGVLCPNLNLAYLKLQSGFLEFLARHGISLRNYVPFYFVYALLVHPVFLDRLRRSSVALVTSFRNKNSAAIAKTLEGLGIRDVSRHEIPESGVAHGEFDLSIAEKVDVTLVGAGIGAPLVLARLQRQSCVAIDAGFIFHLWDGTFDRYERLFLNYEP
jgi:hypothetical protein